MYTLRLVVAWVLLGLTYINGCCAKPFTVWEVYEDTTFSKSVTTNDEVLMDATSCVFAGGKSMLPVDNNFYSELTDLFPRPDNLVAKMEGIESLDYYIDGDLFAFSLAAALEGPAREVIQVPTFDIQELIVVEKENKSEDDDEDDD